MHQPLPLKPDETAVDVPTGGTLTNEGPLIKKQSFGPKLKTWLDIDYMSPMETEIFTINSTTDFIFAMDPGEYHFRNSSWSLPFQHLLPLTCNMAQYSRSIAFHARKHDAVRGKIVFIWYPGLKPAAQTFGASTVFPESAFTYSENQNDVSNVYGQIGADPQAKVERYIWDLEKDDSFLLDLTGTLNTGMRHTKQLPNVTGNTAMGIHIEPLTTFRRSNSMGLLIARMHTPYQSGNIAPTNMNLVMFSGFTKFQGTEFCSVSGNYSITVPKVIS